MNILPLLLNYIISEDLLFCCSLWAPLTVTNPELSPGYHSLMMNKTLMILQVSSGLKAG